MLSVSSDASTRRTGLNICSTKAELFERWRLPPSLRRELGDPINKLETPRRQFNCVKLLEKQTTRYIEKRMRWQDSRKCKKTLTNCK